MTSTATSNEFKRGQILQPITPLDEESLMASTNRSAGKAKEAYHQLRSSLEKLFVYYCDYSVEKGQIFVKQVSFLKLLKDSQILEDKTGSLMNASSSHKAWRTVSEQEVNLLLSKEMNNPQIKALDFQSFLNMLVKIAILLQSKRTSVARIRGSVASSHASTSESQEGTNPKEALESLLSTHVIPLLDNIE